MDVYVSPSLVIPAAELEWQFSRSSGPGGQHVNTSDTRVELRWSVGASQVLSNSLRQQLLQRLNQHLVGQTLILRSSTHRSQLRNREEAAFKLAELVRSALAPAPRNRKPTKPTRGSIQRHRAAQRRRSEIKKLRRRPPLD